MRWSLLTLGLALVTSCSFLPNSVVRVAVPPGETSVQWARVVEALPPGPVPVETVVPGSFPPADLVWFDGNFDDPGFVDGALAPNGQVEAVGTQAGLDPGWFSPEADRLLPVATTASAGVKGFWWNAQGWNRDRVAGFLARLWSKPAQEAWLSVPGWVPIIRSSGPRVTTEPALLAPGPQVPAKE